MKKGRLVFIVSDIEKSLEFEWVANHFVKVTDLHFILIGKRKTKLEFHLKSLGVPCEFVTDESTPSTLLKVLQVFLILKRIKPLVVHCHLWRASLIGLMASYFMGVRKRIFTRHHSMIHYHEFKDGRKWDRLCNFLATDIVAISENVKHVLGLLDKAHETKIHVIHHGFDLSYFENIIDVRIERIKTKYHITSTGPVIGVISRYLELKGIQYVIPAFQKLRETFPSAHLILANASGSYRSEIQKMLRELDPPSFTEIPFEDDLAALYCIFDVFVHVPVDLRQEAFGQTYVEALACGIPSVFTLSGVAPEFIVHEQNALVVPFRDSKSIGDSIKRILTDKGLKQKLIGNGKKSATLFPKEKMLNSLEALYNLKKHS